MLCSEWANGSSIRKGEPLLLVKIRITSFRFLQDFFQGEEINVVMVSEEIPPEVVSAEMIADGRFQSWLCSAENIKAGHYSGKTESKEIEKKTHCKVAIQYPMECNGNLVIIY